MGMRAQLCASALKGLLREAGKEPQVTGQHSVVSATVSLASCSFPGWCPP